MSAPWILRPHHGLCLKHFIGKGYSREFVETMTAVWTELKENPSRRIVLHRGTDRICSSCPHNCRGICETAQKAARYDDKCLTLCGLHDGQILTFAEFERLIMEKILMPRRLSEVCGDCSWSEICQNKTVE